MLAKIISIKSVGRFKDYKASGDATLKRLNVFFGQNGRVFRKLPAVGEAGLEELGSGAAGGEMLGFEVDPGAVFGLVELADVFGM